MAKKARVFHEQTESPAPGHNSGVDNDRRVLFFVDRLAWLKAMEAKKAADAEVKRVGKVIKADLGANGLDMIKAYEKVQTAEGKEEALARRRDLDAAISWAGVPINTQLDIFEDRTPLIERAARDGEEAGLRGDFLSNPYNEGSAEGRAFAEGWHKGQSALFEGIRKKEEAAEDELIKGSDEEADADPDFETQAA